ncbi:MAG: hypothetical protein Kow00108_02220 [Calditrichia bacterium]
MKKNYIFLIISLFISMTLAQGQNQFEKHFIKLTDGRILKGNVDFTHYYFKGKIVLNDTQFFDLSKVERFSCDLGQFEYSFDIGKKYNAKYIKRVLFYQLPSAKIYLYYPWDETFTKEGLATKQPSFYKMHYQDNMKKINFENLLKDFKGTPYERDLQEMQIRKTNWNRLLMFQTLAVIIAMKQDFSGKGYFNPFGSVGDYFNPVKKPISFMGVSIIGTYFVFGRKFEKQLKKILYRFDKE